MRIISGICLVLLAFEGAALMLEPFQREEKWRISGIELIGLLLSGAVLFPVWFLLERLAVCYSNGWTVIAFLLFLFCLMTGGALIYGMPFQKKRLENRLEPHWFARIAREEKGLYCVILLALACSILVTIGLEESSERSQWIGVGLVLLIHVVHLQILRCIAENKLLRRFSDELSKWQLESRDYMNVIRSQRHDFNLHIHALLGMIDNQEYDVCHAYMEKMAEEASEINDIMPVCDPVVGSMLYRMREEARIKGSDIFYKITYDLRDTRCSGFDCVKIIGNLIQNAVDAIQTEEDRKTGIHVSIFKRRGNTVVVVENRFVQDPSVILPVFQVGYSTKLHHEGIGLPMVKRTVEKLGGQIYPEFDAEKIRFVVTIPNTVNLLADDGALMKE